MFACVSGGFDPLHVGHLDSIMAAARLGPVMVLLNSDVWLMRKKGYVFMPWAERAALISALQHVAVVCPVDDEDGTVGQGLRRYRPRYFVKSGDRDESNTPEAALCRELGIELVASIPYRPDVHSADLVRRAAVSC